MDEFFIIEVALAASEVWHCPADEDGDEAPDEGVVHVSDWVKLRQGIPGIIKIN